MGSKGRRGRREHLLPILSAACITMRQPSSSRIPTTPVSESRGSMVDWAYGAPGSTVSEKGEPGSGCAALRSPTCIR